MSESLVRALPSGYPGKASMGNTLAQHLRDVEADQKKALEKHKLSVVRIQDELENLIKIFGHMRECFQNDMMDGLGFKKLTVTDKQLHQAEQLAKIMTNVVAAKIRYEKAAKTLADAMTPEEERKACLDYVKALSTEERKTWLSNLRRWMKGHGESYVDESAQ